MSAGPLTRHQLQELDAQLSGLQCNGHFFDPYADERTRSTWSGVQMATYFAWWSFRPAQCSSCGACDAWLPSPDHEYKCYLCGFGAGSTANTNDIIEDDTHVGENDDDDDANDPMGGAGGQGGGGDMGMGETSRSGAGRPGGEGANGRGAGASDAAPSDQAQGTLLTTQQMLNFLRELPAELQLDVAKYPAILRVATNIIHLFLLPDMNEDSTLVIKSSALYVACTIVTKGLVPFPLFQLSCGVDLQWLDIESIYSHLGIDKSCKSLNFDFFSSPAEYIGNVMIPCGPLRPPYCSWHPDFYVGRLETIAALARRRRRRYSPEQTAAIVIIELIRKYQADHPDDEEMLEWFNKGSTEKFRRYQLLDSTWASAMLSIFANSFRRSTLEVLEMANASGLYRGEMYFYSQLAESLCVNKKYVMPLQRRLSPVRSPWMVIFEALHSDDRLVLLSLLHRIQASATRNATEDADAQTCVQQILRRHGSFYAYQFTYVIRCDDAEEKGMRGVYCCTSVDRRGAVYTCIRTAQRSIVYSGGENPTITIHRARGPSKRVHSLDVQFLGPMVAHIESNCTKLLLDAVTLGLHSEQWVEAQFRLHALLLVRRRLRASKDALETLSNVREFFSAGDQSLTGAASTFLTPLTEIAPVTVFSCAAEVERLLSLPNATLLNGISDDAIMRACCALRALNEKNCERILLRPAEETAAILAEVIRAEDDEELDKKRKRAEGGGTPTVAPTAGAPPRLALTRRFFGLQDVPELRSQLGKVIKAMRQARDAPASVSKE